MKTEVYVLEGALKIKMVPETVEEVGVCYEVATGCKGPVESFGGFYEKGAYAWINVPLRKNRRKDFNNRKA